MKQISVTQGNIAFVDDADYERVVSHSWCIHAAGYAKARINKKYILMHRWLIGAPDGMEVDHINGNKLDNRRCNLRICTSAQNHANKHVFKSKVGYKGVAWNNYHGKYRARLMIHKKDVFLGYFDDPKEAARAYNVAAMEYFGEFARLNVIPAEETYDLA